MYDAEKARSQRLDWLARGECPVCRGLRRVEPGKHRCRVCGVVMSNRQRAYREKRRQRGVCTHCGGPLGGDGRTTCPRCREMVRRNNRKYGGMRDG